MRRPPPPPRARPPTADRPADAGRRRPTDHRRAAPPLRSRRRAVAIATTPLFEAAPIERWAWAGAAIAVDGRAAYCAGTTKLQDTAQYDVGMTKHTARDGVWNLALRQASDGESVTPKWLAQKTDASERTARDVLATMADYGWMAVDEQHYRQNRYEAGERLPKNLTSYETTATGDN